MRIKGEKLGLGAARAVAVGPSDQLLALDEALQQLEEKKTPPESDRGTQVLWGSERGGNRSGSRYLGPGRETRLEHGEGLVVSADQMSPDCWEPIRTGCWRVFGSNELLKYSLDIR